MHARAGMRSRGPAAMGTSTAVLKQGRIAGPFGKLASAGDVCHERLLDRSWPWGWTAPRYVFAGVAARMRTAAAYGRRVMAS